MMKPLQRFKVVAKLGISDQVPVTPFVTGHYLGWFGKIGQKDYWTNPVKRLKKSKVDPIVKTLICHI
jgi:hypothetical protein